MNEMSTTTEMGGIKYQVYEEVYPPSEDTMLLLACVTNYPENALEVCCGAGLISLKLAKGGTRVIATDVDQKACMNTNHNAKINGLNHEISVIRMDLCSGLRGKFDAIYCNPPYLPFDDNVQEDKWWYGGQNGANKTCKLIEQSKNLIRGGGFIMIVTSSLSNIEKIQKALNLGGFVIELVGRRKFGIEEISIIKGFKIY